MAAIGIFLAASHCFFSPSWSKYVHERQKSKIPFIPMQLLSYFEQKILKVGLFLWKKDRDPRISTHEMMQDKFLELSGWRYVGPIVFSQF